ncbi:MAG: 3-isopropylmalate dehydratase small subunit [Rhodospirillaceae bacterium]|nr:3-isopropylmalate dehydratase small subunit [Rhodospirillaceae bacterium]MBT5513828.1 3-isopropylmalate dehydratase small subunit [Rhodospirillaceae bacterium]MBT6086952.1 3-isopropylmalate dehydratase small subunit [Rhodospirillaceae bacterium]MBT6607114.1 3-isopropylmalate dehydratase small subunit [Rhodospirillaceae bacterium]
MGKFTVLSSVAAPIDEKNVNTDIIIPIKRLVGTDRGTFGEFAFEPWRYLTEGVENPDFILNKMPYRNAEILIAGPNFACGSSREGAVWAIQEFGIRALMAPSFGGIFFNNCFQCGILPIVLPAEIIENFMRQAISDGDNPKFTIDLAANEVTAPNGDRTSFEVEPFRRDALLNGLDDLGMTLTRRDEIGAFQATDRETRPWVYL